MAEKAKAETAAQASSATAAQASSATAAQASSASEAEAKSEEKAEAAAAEKAAETESGSKAEAAEKSDGGLPFTAKDGRATVVSKARAGKKIIAKTGEVIEFGADGKASVRAEDAAYLAACGGFDFE